MCISRYMVEILSIRRKTLSKSINQSKVCFFSCLGFSFHSKKFHSETTQFYGEGNLAVVGDLYGDL